MCYKRQRNYVVCNELSSGTVGWVVARGTVGFGSFVVRIWKIFFPKFLSPVSLLRVRVGVRLKVGLGFWLGLVHTVFTDRSRARSQPYVAVLPVGTI